MRHAGLRISDAVMFNVDKIMDDGSIWLRMKKTGEPVSTHAPGTEGGAGYHRTNERGYYLQQRRFDGEDCR